MTKWEYKIYEWPKDKGVATKSELTKVLNDFGQEGWQLAATTPWPILILQRPLPESA